LYQTNPATLHHSRHIFAPGIHIPQRYIAPVRFLRTPGKRGTREAGSQTAPPFFHGISVEIQ
jgi:hypothetical protein